MGVLIVAVAAVVVLFGLVLGWLRLRARMTLAGGGSPLRTVPDERVDDYVDHEAQFVLTVARDFEVSPQRLWSALERDGLFSWIPLVRGIRYRDTDRRTGAVRTAESVFVALRERVVAVTAGRDVIVSGISFSVPLLLQSYVTRYAVLPTRAGSRLEMTVAARPHKGLAAPLRLLAPVLRAAGNLGLRGLQARL